jgi:hypothetical protein
MRVNGVLTRSTCEIMDVQPSEIFRIVKDKIKQNYPRYKDVDYIRDGYCWTYDYTDHHKGTEEYKILRVAYPEDRMINACLKMVWGALNDSIEKIEME